MMYVVIAEKGEYSDRTDWVAGIFTSEKVAQEMIIQKSAESRQYEIDMKAWFKKQWDICTRMIGSNNIGCLSKEQMAEMENEAGPEPDGERGEMFYIVEVPSVDMWGEYKSNYYEPSK